MPIFFASGLILANSLSTTVLIKSADYGVMGGPTNSSNDEISRDYTGLASISTVGEYSGVTESDSAFLISHEASISGGGNPLGGMTLGEGGLRNYTVQKGDTLTKVAERFGISKETILWANSGVKGRQLSPGQEIIILPVSGVLHQVREGETINSISELYGVSADKIRAFNMSIVPGSVAIIPDAKEPKSERIAVSVLPDLRGYFDLPVHGWNWGKLHENNAVDIAASCGNTITASADGAVVEVGDPNMSNDGYGGYILIEHPNSVKTRYAHTEKNIVSIGDMVKKGDKIGLVGSTGNVHGPTGCHVHFEVLGAKNPFAK